MIVTRARRVCIIPDFRGLAVGGPKTFVSKLTAGLRTRGVEVTHDVGNAPFDVVLVVANTRAIPALLRLKGKIPIVHRLDGLYWRHRAQRMPLRWRLRTIAMNLSMAFLRRFVADRVVYQSEFVKTWWNRDYGKLAKPSWVIYNGVDLSRFSPLGEAHRSKAKTCLISVEGYRPFQQVSLEFPVEVTQGLRDRGVEAELRIFGDLHQGFKRAVSRHDFVSVDMVKNERLPFFYRGSHLFVSAEINHGSPNAVIEALACGVPVVGYATGALPELVGDAAGRCVPYAGDFWKLEPPRNPAELIRAALEVLREHQSFSESARQRAVARFGLDDTLDAYTEVLLQ